MATKVSNPPYPKISVCVITYRQENYIAEALRGIDIQDYPGEMEIVVCDDCSPDATFDIVQQWALTQTNPLRQVRCIRHPQNVGMHKNWAAAVEACSGKYVALLEGDDYWTAPDKLSKQCGLMETEPQGSFCFHKVKMRFERDHTQEEYLNQNLGRLRYDIRDIVENGWFIATCSIFFRRSLFQRFPAWVYGQKAVDRPLQLLLADRGDVFLVPEEMGVYRIHGQGISQTQWLGKEKTFKLSRIGIDSNFNRHTRFRHAAFIDKENLKVFEELLKWNMDSFSSFSKIYWKALKLDFFRLLPNKKKLLLEYMPIRPFWIRHFFLKKRI